MNITEKTNRSKVVGTWIGPEHVTLKIWTEAVGGQFISSGLLKMDRLYLHALLTEIERTRADEMQYELPWE